MAPLKLIFNKTAARVWGERASFGLLDRPEIMRAALVIVLLVAALFRFHGLDWDNGRHLHPDERFLSSVTNDLKWPETMEAYFDPQTSTLSPYSLPNMGLYVYGTLPVYIVKWMAIQLGRNDYDAITLLGRALSGLFDLGTILFVFLIGRRLYNAKIGLLAAALLSLSVLNIQLSHFYTVDTFASFFVLATIYVMLHASNSGRWPLFALAGVLFGLGLASKVSVATLGVPIVLGIALTLARRLREGQDVGQALEQTLVRTLTVFGIALLVFRIVQPIAFAGPGFWNWSLNPRWLRDIDEQR
ncbi:MAG TPA: glycosyltransferase family 39 protein, partial [Roseiflexaceae bacterium]|nr:glycosyltransferase family 39 protein [Roseiflexaceae bacterium]